MGVQMNTRHNYFPLISDARRLGSAKSYFFFFFLAAFFFVAIECLLGVFNPRAHFDPGFCFFIGEAVSHS